MFRRWATTFDAANATRTIMWDCRLHLHHLISYTPADTSFILWRVPFFCTVVPVHAASVAIMTSRSNATILPSSGVGRAGKFVDAVYRSLETALEELCSERYGLPLVLNREDDDASEPTWMKVQVERRGVVHMPADIAVSHVGGNIYDVRCTVDEGPSNRYSYCVPGYAEPASVRAPRLGQHLARFLLDELERKLGRQELRRSAIPLPSKFSESIPGDGTSLPDRDRS